MTYSRVSQASFDSRVSTNQLSTIGRRRARRPGIPACTTTHLASRTRHLYPVSTPLPRHHSRTPSIPRRPEQRPREQAHNISDDLHLTYTAPEQRISSRCTTALYDLPVRVPKIVLVPFPDQDDGTLRRVVQAPASWPCCRASVSCPRAYAYLASCIKRGSHAAQHAPALEWHAERIYRRSLEPRRHIDRTRIYQNFTIRTLITACLNHTLRTLAHLQDTPPALIKPGSR